MDRIDSYFLERCDEVRRWSGACDDGSDRFRQFPYFRVVYETDLLEAVKGRSQSSGFRNGQSSPVQ